MFHTFYLKYRNNREFKAGVSLGFSLCVNILYALFKGAVALYYNSQWFAASAYYYTILSMEKIFLRHRLISKKANIIQNYKTCRFCGLSMLILNTAISGMALVIIKNNHATRYPQYMIYLAALFTFYNFGLAVYNIFVYRRLDNPVYSAAKSLNMINAMVSVFFLQVAMLAEFGDGGRWQRDMNIMTGLGVFVITTILALHLFIKSNRQIKQLKAENRRN